VHAKNRISQRHLLLQLIGRALRKLKQYIRPPVLFLRSIYHDNLIVRAFAVPLLTVVPPGILAYAQFHVGLSQYLVTNNWIAVTCAFVGIFPALVSYLASHLNLENTVDPDAKDYLLTCIDQVLGAKVLRVASVAAECEGKQPPTASDALAKASLPERQIELITEKIWQFFEKHKGKSKAQIKVCLVEMDGKHPKKFRYYLPSDRPPRTAIENLRNPRSGFSRALAKGDIIIVEDVVTEANRGRDAHFVSTVPSEQGEQGSMVCYPITCHHSKCTPFVISVYATERRVFSMKDRHALKFVLRTFAQRIIMEHHTETIKRLAK
jgi:hypothetical protein